MKEKKPENLEEKKEMLKLFKEIVSEIKDEDTSLLLGILDYIDKYKKEEAEKNNTRKK